MNQDFQGLTSSWKSLFLLCCGVVGVIDIQEMITRYDCCENRTVLCRSAQVLQMAKISSVPAQIFFADPGENPIERRQKLILILREPASELKGILRPHRRKVCRNIEVFHKCAKLPVFLVFAYLLPISIANLPIQIGFRIDCQHIRAHQEGVQLIKNLRGCLGPDFSASLAGNAGQIELPDKAASRTGSRWIYTPPRLF